MSVVVDETFGSVQRRSQVDRATGNIKLIDQMHGAQHASAQRIWLVDLFQSVFLPQGFPGSVSSDYTRYQVFDTLQAMCSSICGTLSTRSVLYGIGVGEATASVFGGTLQWVLRDVAGMIGRIVFASYVASNLDNDAKRWRLAADLTNDIGMALEIISSHLPGAYFALFLCLASLFKAVTQVAGGCTRASLTQHFAIRHNTADVSAKDGNQETAVSLIGTFVGIIVTWAVPNTLLATVLVFAVFTTLHLWTNYCGVKSLILSHLNAERAALCLNQFLQDHTVPTPLRVRDIEAILVPSSRKKHVTLGASLISVLRRVSQEDPKLFVKTASVAVERIDLMRYVAFLIPRRRLLFRIAHPLLTHSHENGNADAGSARNPGGMDAIVSFSSAATPADFLEAFVLVQTQCQEGRDQQVERKQGKRPTSNVVLIERSGAFVKFFHEFCSALEKEGWQLDRVQFDIADWRVTHHSA